MTKRPSYPVHCILLIAALFLITAGCGGGSTGGSGNPGGSTPPPPPPTLAISTSQLPNGLPGMPYTATLHATGGTGPLTWSADTASGLPAWLNVDSSSGVLSGTPPSSQFVSISIRVTDSGSPHQTASTNFGVLIYQQLSVNTTVGKGNRGLPYGGSLFASGGQFPYTFSQAGGNLPPGINLGSDGFLSGTPTQGGSFTFTVKVADSGNPQQTTTADVTLEIQTLLTITTIPLTNGVIGRSMAPATFGAINGIAPLHWSAQNLPSGLTINANTGVISGTPTQPVGPTPLITVVDSSVPAQSTSAFWNSVTIADVLKILSTDLGEPVVNVTSGSSISFSGGLFPVSVQLVSGTPPDGFQTFGTNINVTATHVGHYSFDLKLSDSGSPPQTAQATFTMDVVPAHPFIRVNEIPRGIVGRPYNLSLSGMQGTPPYSWSISFGSLPDGLMLDSQGLIHGTPTTAGISQFTVLLTDSGAPTQTATATLSIQILAHALGRNDTIATATPIGNGIINASISPYSDPSSNGPDGDYFKLTANPGSTVVVAVFARRIFPLSTLDSVLEVVDASGTRFTTCNDPIQPFLQAPAVLDPNPNDFNNSCINDDNPANNTTDSDLQFKVPGTSGPPVTFYVHIIDFRGDARPDMIYELSISGAN